MSSSTIRNAEVFTVSISGSSDNGIYTYEIEYGAEIENLSTLETEAVHDRYRRLIPYMTYYLENNYVGPQHQAVSSLSDQGYTDTQSEIPFIRKPTLPKINLKPIHSKPRQQIHQPQDSQGFVPSVQYNPKEIKGQGMYYFVPLKYGVKDDYNYYKPSNQYTRRLGSTKSSTRYEATPSPVNFELPKQKQLFAKTQTNYADGDDREKFDSLYFAMPTQVKLHQDLMKYARPVVLKPAGPESVQPVVHVSINHILKSLQLTNQLPENLDRSNIDSSIKTLLEILNILNMGKKENYIPVYNKIKTTYVEPKVITESNYQATRISAAPQKEFIAIKNINPYVNQIKTEKTTVRGELINTQPINLYTNKIKNEISISPQAKNTIQNVPDKVVEYYLPIIQDITQGKIVPISEVEHSEPQSNVNYDIFENNDQLEDERYNLPIMTKEQKKKLRINIKTIPSSLKYGVTRGKPHVDYPAYTEIPETKFSCKQQRYKGFFGDPDTGCQVWHYCDLNGGKSSFLCPNGTIFSQVALTCDWWFNVKCESTTQLYVLNERLYKYILPIMPKFPEDFTGPEVDKYLELKFKEMEEKIKEKQIENEQEVKSKASINTLQSIEDSK